MSAQAKSHGSPLFGRELNESFYFMCVALEEYFTRKYPVSADAVREMACAVRGCLGAAPPSGGGCVGAIQGYFDFFDEILSQKNSKEVLSVEADRF